MSDETDQVTTTQSKPPMAGFPEEGPRERVYDWKAMGIEEVHSDEPMGNKEMASYGDKPERYSEREQILDGAKEAVMHQRNNVYGPPTQDFDRTAGVLNALGFKFEDGPIESHHVAMIQTAVKLSRLTWTKLHKDSWMDLAGYAACGYECAVASEIK